MPAASYDIFIEQGATFRLTMVYGFDSGTVDVNGDPITTPYDITGCDIRMQIRQRRGATPLITATTGNGAVSIVDGPAGKLQVTLTATQTNQLAVSRALYDLEVEFPSGDVTRVIQGKVTVSPNITQDADVDDDPVTP